MTSVNYNEIMCSFLFTRKKIETNINLNILTLFRPGGGRIPPAATLDVNNFFNIKTNATKLGDFFQNLTGTNLI